MLYLEQIRQGRLRSGHSISVKSQLDVDLRRSTLNLCGICRRF